MLEGLRVASQNWIGRTIMALVMGVIVISFSIWGVGDVFRGMTAQRLARVGSGEVGRDLSQRLSKRAPPHSAADAARNHQ